jgi:hypothetical protein
MGVGVILVKHRWYTLLNSQSRSLDKHRQFKRLPCPPFLTHPQLLMICKTNMEIHFSTVGIFFLNGVLKVFAVHVAAFILS